MAMQREWTIQLYKDLLGEVSLALYQVEEDGQLSMVANEEFGPFDTASDICAWIVRHWAPRAGLVLH